MGKAGIRVHVLQHVAFEGLGSIAEWLDVQQARVSCTAFFEPHWQLPPVDSFDLLIALGGPMSVNDEAELPWLSAEKAFVAQSIAAGKAVLGICLGAQLIASAQGAKVYPGPNKEIGWWPLQGLSVSAEQFAFPLQLDVFHWHGETFDLPSGAVHLARSEGCAHQAFQLGARVLGLQFHLEATPETAQALRTHCADEVQREAGKPFVQSDHDLAQAPLERYAEVNQLMTRILEWLVR